MARGVAGRAVYRYDETWTYFAFDGTAIKIGKTVDLASRIEKLQTGNPRKLEVIGVVMGDRESELHGLFDDYSLNHEWFVLATEIIVWLRENGYVNESVVGIAWTAAISKQEAKAKQAATRLPAVSTRLREVGQEDQGENALLRPLGEPGRSPGGVPGIPGGVSQN